MKRIVAINEDAIEAYLSASERPFDNRLQVICYMWLSVNAPGSQEKVQAAAKDLARTLGQYIYLDADRPV